MYAQRSDLYLGRIGLTSPSSLENKRSTFSKNTVTENKAFPSVSVVRTSFYHDWDIDRDIERDRETDSETERDRDR